MKVFPFPKDHKNYPVCGTKDEKDAVLVPISGTESGGNIEAIPIHTECLLTSVRYYPKLSPENKQDSLIVIFCKE